MGNHDLLKLSFRLLVAWLALSLIGIMIGEQLITLLLPFFSDIINAMSSRYSHALSLTNLNGRAMIEITARLTQAIRATNTLALTPGETVTAAIDVWHVLVPLVILFSLLIALPTRRARESLQRLLLAMPVALIILAFNTPALLAGHIEMQLSRFIQNVGGIPNDPFLIRWVVFMEMGGRWLLPIVGAASCVMMSKGIDNLRREFHNIGNKTNNTDKRKKTRKEKKREKKDNLKNRMAGRSNYQ